MKKKYTPQLILLIHILALILFHVFAYTGHFGYDDIHYADLANSLNHGAINFDDHASFRFPVLLFTAISYRIFGLNDFASSFPSMILAIGVVVMVFQVLKHKNLTTLIIGLSLTTFTPWFLFYSDKLMPDFYIVFAVVLSLFILYSFKFKSKKRNPALYALLLAFALLFGFMAKGTIVLVLPLFFYLFLIDMVKKRDVKFWLYFIGSGVLALVIYFFAIWLLTGDVAKRFHAIAQNSYINLCSYDKQPIAFLLRRLAYEFFDMMLYQFMLVGLLFVIAAFMHKGAKRYWYIDDSYSFFLVSALILFLSSNFMSISFTSYVPLCLDPRHYLFLVPLAAIPAAELIAGFIRNRKHAVSVLILMVLLAVLAFAFLRNTFWMLYFPLALLFILYLPVADKPIYRRIFLILFIAVLLIKPTSMVRSAQDYQYRKQRSVVFEHILNTTENCVVVTNDVQKRLGRYYAGFDDDGKVQFVNYEEFKPDSLDHRKLLLLMSYHTRTMTNQTIDDLPYYARNINPENPLVYENKRLGITIYELNNIELPEFTGTELLNSINDFENPVNYWGQSETTNRISANGKYSSITGLYSSTFALTIDSLAFRAFSQIVITASVNCYFEEKANCSLVVSLENAEGTYEWKGLNIEKEIKAYSHWWPIKYEHTMDTGGIKEQSLLKIYLLNQNENKVYIDDFNVKIVGLK